MSDEPHTPIFTLMVEANDFDRIMIEELLPVKIMGIPVEVVFVNEDGDD